MSRGWWREGWWRRTRRLFAPILYLQPLDSLEFPEIVGDKDETLRECLGRDQQVVRPDRLTYDFEIRSDPTVCGGRAEIKVQTLNILHKLIDACMVLSQASALVRPVAKLSDRYGAETEITRIGSLNTGYDA